MKNTLLKLLLALTFTSTLFSSEQVMKKEQIQEIAKIEYSDRMKLLQDIIVAFIKEKSRTPKEVVDECYELYDAFFAGTVCHKYGGDELKKKFEKECEELSVAILQKVYKN